MWLNTSNQYALISHAQGQEKNLAGWADTHAVLPRGTNRIVISAVGSNLDVFVNDRRLARVTDSTWNRGQIGWGVWSADRQAATVDFDNVAICAPAP